MTATAPDRADAPLDDVMLAMDVVDTLRQRRAVVERELDEPGREAELLARLRDIYAAQGIAVPDEVLQQGVAALAEERFVYRSAPPSWNTTLARIYVSRRVWGTWLVALVAVAAVALYGYRAEVVAPRAALPAELDRAYQAVVAVATVPEGATRGQALRAEGERALARRDYAAAETAIAGLAALQARLEQRYTVRIVNRPGVPSGVWRVPDVNPSGRNYYLIVEAVAPDGRVLQVPVRNEESGTTETVARWGLRVDEATYQAVARDKGDDGIIQDDVVGEKLRGALDPTYRVATSGAAITRW